MNSKWYWLIRQKYRNLKFQIKKAAFRLNERKESSERLSSFSRIVIRTLLVQVAINLVLVAVLYVGDKLLLSAMEIFAKTQTDPLIAALSESILVDIVIGGIGVAGVILGLYCSNMTSVYSSKYTNAPATISSAFQRDVVTNRCIKQITGYIIFCVIILFGCLIGISFSYVSIIALLFLTIRMIITFSITGNRMYQLSNTFNISDNLYPEIYSAIRKISANNHFSNDPNFQNHYQKICTKQFKILQDIAAYNKDNPINQNPAMLSFINNNLALISVYWGVKEKIHYDSFWYRSETQYKKWHTATDTEISLALNTGVSLQAMSVIKNRWWFEQDLLRINNICVEKLCAENDLNTLYSYLNIVAQLSSQAMESGCLLFWTKSVVDLQEKILPACIACAKSDDKNHVILAAAIADVFIGIYINIIIGINKYLRELNIDSLLNCATEAYSYEQLKPNNRYYNNHSVEHLFNCIFAELKLESKRVTPDWYIKQAVAYTVYQDLNDVVDAMDKIYNNVFSVGKRLTENKCYLQGATVLSRLFELSSKASMALTSLNTFFPKLEALHFEPTVVWDKCHLKQFLTRRKEIEKRFPPYLVKCCGETTLAHWRDREDFPDSLGFCYNQLCEYLVVAIEDDDFESFKSAYSGFFGVVLLYHEYVRSDVVKIKELHKQSAVFHVVTAPLIEYAIISGLAILWGEFSENRQWRELVDAELSEFVSKDEKKREILTKIIEMLSYRKGHMLGIGNRDLIQTNWVQRITNSIRVSGLCHYEYKDWGIKVLKTESTLLKAFCGTSFENLGFADNVEDLYLILCLNQYVPSEKQYESRSKWEKNLHETDTQ